jgi:hypothetical protein
MRIQPKHVGEEKSVGYAMVKCPWSNVISLARLNVSEFGVLDEYLYSVEWQKPAGKRAKKTLV